MTADEAIAIAARKATQLNMPWGPNVTATPLFRIWPFPRVWRVRCVVPEESSESTLDVSGWTRKAVPRRVHVHKRFGEPPVST
jgi:hypothetical protein